MDPNFKTIARQRSQFGQRIYDDLCEDLLLWLPINDKLKLRSVSKQFDLCLGTLLKRQRVLDLNEWFKPGQQEINSNGLTEIFQISPNIKEIQISNLDWTYPDRYRGVLPRITALAKNLDSIEFKGNNGIEIQDLRIFAEKFGPNLKSIALIDSQELSDESVRHLLKCSSQLRSLNIDVWTLYKCCMFETEGNFKKIVVRNLENLKIKTESNFNSQEILEIVDKNQFLKHLLIDIVVETQAEASVTVRKISELKELTDLEIYFVGSSFTLSAELIAVNLNKLKNLSLTVSYSLGFDAKKLFNKLKEFSSLIRIHIHFQNIFGNAVNFDIGCIRNCKQLIHLSLLSRQLIITEEFWKQISFAFIKLKEIKLYTSFESGITDNDLLCLSKCKSLQKVVLVTYHNVLPAVSFTEFGFISLVNDCKDLFSIRCFIPFLVTESLHNAMVAKAVKNPDIEYGYMFEKPNEPNQSKSLSPTYPSDLSNLQIVYT